MRLLRPVLPREFYERDPAIVAVDLLGQILRVDRGGVRECIIVETEAYYGPWDPASRASMHRRGRIVERLRGPPGVLLVYGVHANWMVNVTAHPPGGWGAVLLRACAPLRGVHASMRGPGRLSRAMGIGRWADGITVYEEDSPVTVVLGPGRIWEAHVARDHRVGVRRDLEEPLRFCLNWTGHVSKPCKVGSKHIYSKGAFPL